jgi:hypothetical protein
VGEQQRAHRAGEAGEVRARLALGLEAEIGAEDVVHHQVDHLLLALDVAVEGGRADAERGGQRAHRDRLDALRVGQLHRRRGDVDAAQRGGRPAAAALGPRPDHLRGLLLLRHCEQCTQSATVLALVNCERCSQ